MRQRLSGALMMAAGHFLMAFEAAFLPALAALVVGSGLLKGNLAAQVGNLYGKHDGRRDAAYTVYVTAINIGLFAAPLVCGTLGEVYGWHWGFGAAGIGMLGGLTLYVLCQRWLPAETAVPRSQDVETGGGTTPHHALRQRVIALVAVALCVMLFRGAYEQTGNTIAFTYTAGNQGLVTDGQPR